MSIRAMAQVWEREEFDPYERLVMLALADHANDDGVCYPSVARLRKRTGMKDRGIQNVIKRLCEKGFLTVDYNAGKGGSNVYRMDLDPRTGCTPAPDAPPAYDAPPPRTGCTTPPHPITSTPASGADEPSGTVKEPSGKQEAREARDILCQQATPAAVDSFIRFRKKLRKPVTVIAAKRQAKQLQRIFDAGFDPDDALGMAEEKGWQSVQADWYFNAKGSTHGKLSDDFPHPGRPANHPDDHPQLRSILSAAGAFEAPGWDRGDG